MHFGVVTLFPDMFNALNYGIVGRAIEKELIRIGCWNPRDYTQDRHQSVDDRPYGGGPGMLMLADPLCQAIQAAKQQLGEQSKTIYLSPQGQPIKQAMLDDAATEASSLILLAGRYEGIDQRVIETQVDEQWSLGDYVLSGGEFAAMAVIDGITRLLPEALGDALSAVEDSFVNGLLDYPHYTRPEVYQDQTVPSVLLSGNHKEIAKWRLKQALGQTWLQRPDLLAEKTLNDQQQALLAEFIAEKQRQKLGE